jgi:glycosyltransferase involved in cell wall biosynthesis
MPDQTKVMRILIAYNLHRHGGGSDEVAKKTVDLLCQAGHEVRVLVRDSGALNGLRGAVSACIKSVYASDTQREMAAAVGDFKPDVVHAHEVYPLISPGALIVARRQGVPVVLTCHDYRLSCPIATHHRSGHLCFKCAGTAGWSCLMHNCAEDIAKSASYALRHAVTRRRALFERSVNLYLTPSQNAKNMLCRYVGLQPERVTVVGNPVPGPADATPSSTRVEAYIGYAGRMQPEKGFDVLLQALKGTGLPLRVAGEPPRHPLSPDVSFTGHLDRKGMSDFYRQARLLVVPSLWHETFGLVVAESLACETPVIVSDLGALSEVAGPGGVVVPAGDVRAWRDAVISLWNDPERCQQLGQAGHEHVKRYSDERYTENVLTGYRRAIELNVA